MIIAELDNAVSRLKAERTKTEKELQRLSKAISVLEGLSAGGQNSSTQTAGRRTLSAAARRKIARAQKARWAKVKQQQAARA